MATIHIATEAELPTVAKAVLEHLPHGGTVLLHGDLGAGKTTLVRACCTRLGIPAGEVSSPTFSIVNEYALPEGDAVYHIDLYRLEVPEEAEDIGLEEYLAYGKYCFIEWPDIATHLLPDDKLTVQITTTEQGGRKVVLL